MRTKLSLRPQDAGRKKISGPAPTPFVIATSAWSEFVLSAWDYRTLSNGAVSSWAAATGVRARTATQATGANQPTKDADGVKITAGQTHFLTYAAETDAPYSHRMGIIIFKAAAATTGEQGLATICGYSGNAFHRQPYFRLNTGGTAETSVYDSGGAKTLSQTFVVNDWNILVFYRRGGKAFQRLNGNAATPVSLGAWTPNNVAALCNIGYSVGAANKDVWIKTLQYWHGEFTDEAIALIEGAIVWDYLGSGSILANGHIAKGAAPPQSLADAQFPSLHIHPTTQWNAWKALSQATQVPNWGQSGTGSTVGLVPTFFDDFTSTTWGTDVATTDAAIWRGPSWATTIGVSATNAAGNDATAFTQSGSEIRLRLYHNGSNWVAPVLMTIDKNGRGRFWECGRIEWKQRAVVPTPADPPALRPALWGYDRDHLIFRTRNRLEYDFVEYDGGSTAGSNPGYVNTTVHSHAPTIDASVVGVSAEDNHKALGRNTSYNLNTGDGFPFTMDFWNGSNYWMAWVINPDGTFWMEVSANGTDWYRTFDMPALSTLLRPKNIIINNAVDTTNVVIAGGAPPSTSEVYDVFIDYVRVMEPESFLATVKDGFTAQPTISGTGTLGQTLTVVPNAASSTHLEYDWIDGLGRPLLGEVGSTHVVTSNDVATGAVRCRVTNYNHKARPYMWSAAKTLS